MVSKYFNNLLFAELAGLDNVRVWSYTHSSHLQSEVQHFPDIWQSRGCDGRCLCNDMGQLILKVKPNL